MNWSKIRKIEIAHQLILKPRQPDVLNFDTALVRLMHYLSLIVFITPIIIQGYRALFGYHFSQLYILVLGNELTIFHDYYGDLFNNSK